MKIAIPKERRPGEDRVAISPEVAKKLVGLGFSVIVEKGAGLGSSITDAALVDAGATIADSAQEAFAQADMVWKIRAPMLAEEGFDEVALLKEGTLLLAHLSALTSPALVAALARRKITAFAMELMPRISRAQSMDILSSQSNLAGYRSVIDGAYEFGRAFPMMMTAAGTVPPARVLVFGAGVAGLQAIATAKRLGAIVMATDVRPATKEQVESLGGKFITVDDEAMKKAETSGGYAKEMDDEFKKKQAAAVLKELVRTDIAITTALIPGRPAPVLITEEMVNQMKPGSVIVDLAVEAGGNCPLSRPDEIVVHNRVKIVGHTNVAGRLATDASPLFAKNLLNFITPQVDKAAKTLALKFEDETVSGTCVTRDGAVVHPALQAKPAEVKAEPAPAPVAEVKAEPAPAPVAEVKAEPAPAPVAEVKAEPAPAPIAEVKAEPAPAPAAEVKAKPAPAPVAEVKAEPAPAPVAEVKAEPAPAPVAEVKAEPAPAPVAEVKAKAEPAPAAEVKAEPAPAPVAEAEVKPAPRPTNNAPRKGPAGAGKRPGKGGR